MNRTHSPGPWTGVNSILAANGETVAEVFALESDCGVRHGQGTADANARLIAAAPTLLEVLREVADFWAGGDVPEELDKKMRAAIAMAEGSGAMTRYAWGDREFSARDDSEALTLTDKSQTLYAVWWVAGVQHRRVISRENARLIASAPDLLNVLCACDETFAMWQVGAIPGRPEDTLRLIRMVRNAIAKATAL